jgi:hypothetical protein
VGSGQIEPDVDLEFLRRCLLGSANSTKLRYQSDGDRNPDQITAGILTVVELGVATPSTRANDTVTRRRESSLAMTPDPESPHPVTARNLDTGTGV